jgi:hypothetical protein
VSRREFFYELGGPQSHIAPGGRLILCLGGGGGGTSKTTQEIPKELKPLATAYTKKALNLSDNPYVGFGDGRFAGLDALQKSGINQIKNRAINGSGTMDTAENAINQMVKGTSNPYLDQAVERAQDSVTSNFNTAAVNSGSFGNSGLQEQFTKNLGDVAGQMYGNAYEGDQARRLQAAGMAPTFANQDYQDGQQLLNAGQILQDQAQQGKDFRYQQFVEKQDLPYKQLAAMSGVFGTNLGGSAKTTQSGGGK